MGVALAVVVGGEAATVTIGDCGGESHSRPGEIILACGDGSHGVRRLAWSHWGKDPAVADGAGYVNLCEPSCVEGQTVDYPVRVELSDLRRAKGSTGYRRLDVVATGQRPEIIAGHEVYRLTDTGPVFVR